MLTGPSYWTAHLARSGFSKQRTALLDPTRALLLRRRELCQIVTRLCEIGVERQRACEVGTRRFGLSQCLQRDAAIVHVLRIRRVERERTAELFECGIGLPFSK